MADRRRRAGRDSRGRVVRSACVGLGLLLAPHGSGAITYDWCSTIVVRPDTYFANPATCTSMWPDQIIATGGAEVVLVGDGVDVAHPVTPAPGRACYPNPNHAANAPYVQRLRSARAAAGGPPLLIVHMTRVELVPKTYAALAGFDPAFLLGTDRPFSEVQAFFANDRSAPCVAGDCRWSDSWGGEPATDPPGVRLRDFIDARGGANRYQGVVYYLNRLFDPKVHWPSAAIADLRSPSYRAWRVAEAKEAVRIGGYDAIDLSQKFFQYQENGHWIGTALAPNVATLNQDPTEAMWSAPPRGYGYAEYVQGWVQLARDLRAAGVPYTISIALRAWQSDSTRFDDPSTPGVNEADLVREAMRGARLLLLDRDRNMPQAESNQVVQEVRAAGPSVVLYDQTCGQSGVNLPGVPGLPQVR